VQVGCSRPECFERSDGGSAHVVLDRGVDLEPIGDARADGDALVPDVQVHRHPNDARRGVDLPRHADTDAGHRLRVADVLENAIDRGRGAREDRRRIARVGR
jgi:hypothetical protein